MNIIATVLIDAAQTTSATTRQPSRTPTSSFPGSRSTSKRAQKPQFVRSQKLFVTTCCTSSCRSLIGILVCMYYQFIYGYMVHYYIQVYQSQDGHIDSDGCSTPHIAILSTRGPVRSQQNRPGERFVRAEHRSHSATGAPVVGFASILAPSPP